MDILASLHYFLFRVVVISAYGKVPSQKGNEFQHVRLRHCSYITQSKLQHILVSFMIQANPMFCDKKILSPYACDIHIDYTTH